ncbi:MAG TPA: cyclodeaminase/cyclohydrolase family protein [Clostridiaceae bacterium]|nr:cyclodeaminase/cyclohydrolase family protein [Clostridiaceae bacterium]
MKEFKHLPISDYLGRAASDSPTPGGGSVASLVGALGAALGQMVYNLTHTKKSYLANDEMTKAAVQSDFNALVRLQEDLTDLIDKDILAFNSFMDALSLPRETDEEKAARSKAMADATVLATQAPLETATKSFEVLQHLGSLSRYGHKNCISDAGVSAYLAHAALKSAVMNVRINVPGLEDRAFAEKAERTCVALLEEAEKLTKEIEVIVYERL